MIVGVSSTQSLAQSASPLSVPGLGSVGSFFGFGGGKEAKERKQDIQFALDKAHQAALMAEEVQQTVSLIEHIGDTSVLGLIGEAAGLQRDVSLLSKQLEEVFDDDFGGGDLPSDIEYKTRQLNRAVGRLDEIHKSVEEYAEEQVAIRDGTTESLGAVRSAAGVMGATQGVAEIGAMGVAATQNNTRVLGDILAIEAARESRDMEDKMLAKIRACNRNKDNEYFQRDHCS